MENKKITGKECKFVFHLEAVEDYRDDTHIIKEVIHYEDGTTKDNLKIVKNFKIPFWITKPHYQNHTEKKESETLDRLNRFTSTVSNLPKAIGIKLGPRFSHVKSMRDVIVSPYVYGTDISSNAIIKQTYIDHYGDIVSNWRIAVLDIETDTVTGEIILITVATYGKMYTVALNKILKGRKDVKSQLDYLYNKYIPKTEISKNMEREFDTSDTVSGLVVKAIAKLHEYKPDIATVWNIDYDIPMMVEALEKDNIDPAKVFSEPSLPENLKVFKYLQGQKARVTESGVHKSLPPEEQWHTVYAPANFYWIDAMSAHRYIRVGGKTTPGGYSLDNILKQELGKDLQKLKFNDDPKMENLHGIEWHQYMVANKIMEYIIYNQWDVMSMLELDNKTKDLVVTLPMLAGISDFKIFNSGPKRIVEALHFFYLENKRVLGSKPAKVDNDKVLGLGDWIKR